MKNSKYSCTNIYTHFENPFEDWDSTQENDSEKLPVLEPYKDKFTKIYKAMLKELEEHINASDDRNYDVYSGTAGYGLLYLHLYEINPDKGDHSYLHNALDFIKGPIDNLKE